MMVSPGTAGLSGVTRPMFAQHNCGVSAVKMIWPPSLFRAENLMPLPAGPGTLARRRMRVKEPAAKSLHLRILVDQVDQTIANDLLRVVFHYRIGVGTILDGHRGYIPA